MHLAPSLHQVQCANGLRSTTSTCQLTTEITESSLKSKQKKIGLRNDPCLVVPPPSKRAILASNTKEAVGGISKEPTIYLFRVNNQTYLELIMELVHVISALAVPDQNRNGAGSDFRKALPQR